MEKPLLPDNENLRLQALHKTGILDTPAEERYDRLTRIAKQLFDVPIALVSMVDAKRQWLKSRQGLDTCETDRDISFCGHAIHSQDIFEIPDARRDSRFADNPLVVGAPHIRFYAVAPLLVNGYAIGTLCIIDRQPRLLTNEQRNALRDLADAVISECELVGQREINQQLSRLSRVANETTNAVVITDTYGQVEWINDGFTRITGYSLAEVHGRKPGNLLQGPETDPETVATMRESISRLESFEVDVVNYTKSDQPYWIHISCNPLFNEESVLQGFMAIESDITATKKAEEALLASEERLRGLFELSPIGIALNDFNTGEFLDINEAMLKPTGYSREEFAALSYWDLTPREYEPREALQLQSLEETDRYGPYEKEYIRKDGSRYPVLLNGMVVYDNTGRQMIWSIIEDISERKRVERMKNEFISTVSHELRTPLTSISGALGLLVGGAVGGIPQQAQQMLEIAQRNSQRLSFLVNDLLDMEKLVAGKMHFDLRIQPLQPLMEKALIDNQTYADQFGVQLCLRRSSKNLQVKVDSHRFQQVMANLLSNAIKFSPSGEVVHVFINCMRGWVRISVKDNGPGIPESFQNQVFEKFSQADSSDSRNQTGSGMGLAITRELMSQMDGNVNFETMAGKGSTFFVEFPVVLNIEQTGVL